MNHFKQFEARVASSKRARRESRETALRILYGNRRYVSGEEREDLEARIRKIEEELKEK